MANHLEIDFEALAIDVHLIEGTQIAVLTIVSIDKSLEVSLPLQALEQFRDRISGTASRSKSSHSDAGTTHRSLRSTDGSLIRERI